MEPSLWLLHLQVIKKVAVLLSTILHGVIYDISLLFLSGYEHSVFSNTPNFSLIYVKKGCGLV